MCWQKQVKELIQESNVSPPFLAWVSEGDSWRMELSWQTQSSGLVRRVRKSLLGNWNKMPCARGSWSLKPMGPSCWFIPWLFPSAIQLLSAPLGLSSGHSCGSMPCHIQSSILSLFINEYHLPRKHYPIDSENLKSGKGKQIIRQGQGS